MVRNELKSLLVAKPPYGCVPDRSQIAAFEAEWERTGRGAKACNAMTTDFMIDIVGALKSPWNVSAGRAFSGHLIKKIGCDDTEEMRMAIEKVFCNRVKGLKTQYKRDGLPQVEKAAEKSRHSRHQRKYQVIIVSFRG